MDNFHYPLDAEALIRKKKSIKKELLKQNNDWIDKRIAVLGGSTSFEVVDQLELALLNHGIRAEFYQSDYNMFWEDAVFGNEALFGFKPDVVYIYTNWRNIQRFPEIEDESEEINHLLEREFDRFHQMWDGLKCNFDCPIIQNNFDRPNYRLLGNRDIWDPHGRSNYLSRLNQKLYEYACEEDDFFINDIDYLAQNYGLAEWNSAYYWNLYKYAMNLNAVPWVAESVANIIKSIFGKNKKVLALDLDNTLWGGEVGEEGVAGIHIGVEDSLGQTFYEFQNYCKELRKIGVALAVVSKNDEKNAVAGLEETDGVLKRNDFVSFKANWNDKDQNILDIASELSVSTDSIVYIDDNPAERELVKSQIQHICVPSVDKAEDFIGVLDHSGFFEATYLTDEDLNKSDNYSSRAEAKRYEMKFEDFNDYLNSLEMNAEILGFNGKSVPRVAQLTNKTNQFNLTTLRCSDSDIRKMDDDPNYLCICARLSDRFSNHGIVTAVAGEVIDFELHIRLWIMSCRVLKRGLEDFLMNELVLRARKMGVKQIVGYYYPTQKNSMVEFFFKDRGFSLKSRDEFGNAVWGINIADYSPLTICIEKRINKKE